MRDQHFRSYICINEHKRTPLGFKNPTGFYFAAPPAPRRAPHLCGGICGSKKPQMRARSAESCILFLRRFTAREILQRLRKPRKAELFGNARLNATVTASSTIPTARAAFMRRHLRLKKPQMRARSAESCILSFAAFCCARNIAKVEKAAKSGAFHASAAFYNPTGDFFTRIARRLGRKIVRH